MRPFHLSTPLHRASPTEKTSGDPPVDNIASVSESNTLVADWTLGNNHATLPMVVPVEAPVVHLTVSFPDSKWIRGL